MKIRRILLVDNNATIVEIVGARLAEAGFDVIKAYDGMQALEMLEDAPHLPDAIILDLIMPKIDGQRLTKILKQDDRYAAIPIIILTGIAAEEDGKILTVGADAHIAKGKIDETFTHIMETLTWLDERPPPYEQRDDIIGVEKLYPREMTRELLLVKRHYDSMLATMEEGVVEIDQRHRVIFANPAACRLLGCEENALFSNELPSLFGGDSALAHYLDRLPDRAPDSRESVELVRDGHTIRALATPFTFDGAYEGAIVILADITALVRREKDLELLMEAIVRNAPVGLCLLDDSQQILVANPAFNATLQQGPAWSPVGRALADVLSAGDHPLLEAAAEGFALPPGRMVGFRTDYLHPGDGTRQVLNISASSLEVAGRQRLLLLVEDITDKASLEEHLRRANEELETANRTKSTFLSMVSHELRTPLSVVRGYVSLILDGKIGPEHEKIIGALSIADKRARQLQHLIEELLDLSRIEAGALSIKRERITIDKHLREVVEMLREESDHKGLAVEIDIPGDLPPIQADHDKVHQIFTNLVSNAIKFSEKGGRIVITGRREGDEEVFHVRDTGIGIPASKLDRIFDKFYQVDSSDTRRHTGTGLGLSIVKMILNALGGTIRVTSTIGEGSTFTFTLPVGKTAPGEAEEAAPEAPAPAAEPAPGEAKKRVLAVEDDPDTLSLIHLILSEEEFEVVEAHDAFRGLREFMLRPPDIVLADALLPVMTGLDLCRIIRTSPEAGSTPVVILSAAAQEDEIRQGYDVGANDYLVKPFAAEDLLETVRRHLA